MPSPPDAERIECRPSPGAPESDQMRPQTRPGRPGVACRREGSSLGNRDKSGIAVPAAGVAELSAAQRTLVAAYVVAGFCYLAWRPGTFNPDALVFSAAVYAVEMFGFVASLLHLLTCWRLRRRAPLPVPANATVAVLVPTIDEPVEMVRRTLMAAQRMKHAHEVWLLDDGHRPEMQVLAEELGCRYLARGTRHHDKSGNLNNALCHTRAGFIAVFDADHAPAPGFLEETLGFFAEDSVAFVQTPQDFYHFDSLERRPPGAGSVPWSEQSLFCRVIQPGRDRFDAALFRGSCAVLRRSALDEAGGFAVGSPAADLLTSISLHRRGWKSVYYARSLALGLAPEGAAPFMSPRSRRGRGTMRAWRREGGVLARGLSAGQRIAYLATMLRRLAGWQRAVFFLVPVVALATGVLPVATFDAGFLALLFSYYALAVWSFEEVARGYGRTLLREQYAMMRFAACLAAMSGHVRLEPRARVASNAAGSGGPPRDSMWPQCAVLATGAIAIALGLVALGNDDGLPPVALAVSLLWAALTMGIAAASIRLALHGSSSRRRECRFPLPVPVRVHGPRGPLLGLASDVSSNGCRIVGAPVAGVRGGDELQGELLLPTGVLPVRAQVRTVLADGVTAAPVALGCEFRWGLSDERSQLEMFLLGSDLQWHLNGVEQRVRTPLERATGRLQGRRPVRRLGGRQWSPVLCRRANTGQEAGIGFVSAAARDGAPRTLVSLGSLPTDGRLFAEEITPTGARGGVVRVADEQVLETHAAPIYVYRLTA